MVCIEYDGDGDVTIMKLERPVDEKLDRPFVMLERPKFRMIRQHFSEPDSQGTMICETKNFPSAYNEETEKYNTLYSDRARSFNIDTYNKACEIGGNDQFWASRLPGLRDKGLKEFAKILFGLNGNPKHVRVVYYFNCYNGYDTPVVEVIVDKEE